MPKKITSKPTKPKKTLSKISNGTPPTKIVDLDKDGGVIVIDNEWNDDWLKNISGAKEDELHIFELAFGNKRKTGADNDKSTEL